MVLNFGSPFYFSLLNTLLKVCVGGVVIGLLHVYPKLLTLILFGLILFKILKDAQNPRMKNKLKIIIIGMTISFLMGALSEWIGTEHGWWIYHLYESSVIKFPPWVPLAWAIAFRIFFGFENRWLSDLRNGAHLRGILILVLILPPVGEMIAMHLGTWYYTFQPQFLMMPVQAVILIAFVHLLCKFLVDRFAAAVQV